MIIALIIAGSLITWCAGAGYSTRYFDKNTGWCGESCVAAGLLIWPLALPAVAAFANHDRVESWLERKRRLKALPPIYVKKGAKIEEFEQYREIKRLCSDFEIENNFDRLLED